MSKSWCAFALIPLVSGCLAFGGGYEIRFDESLRYPVRFASIEAQPDDQAFERCVEIRLESTNSLASN